MQKLVATLFALFLMVPAVFAAQLPGHVVPPSDLRHDARQAAQARQADEAQLRSFLHSEAARGALESMKLDASKVDRAIPQLSDAELARLAAQSRQVQDDFAAGRLTNAQVTYIILGAILIIIIALLVK